jgi:hypothetical protein
MHVMWTASYSAFAACFSASHSFSGQLLTELADTHRFWGLYDAIRPERAVRV